VHPIIKPAFGVISICVIAVILILSGAQATQSSTSLQSRFDTTLVFTSTLTTTAAITPTPTPVFTSTPTPTATITATPTPTPIVFVVEEPEITPAYAGMCDSYWYSYTNTRGYYAYLTLNVKDPANSTNSGVWRPDLPLRGYYLLEAYIPSHPSIPWECPYRTISSDTSEARYTILHANGQSLVTGTQKSYQNEWLPLGEFLFHANSEGYVRLTDLNNEENLTTTISFSALRFTWLSPPPTSLYLPIVGKLASSVITDSVGIQNAPALDQCHLPSTAQMQTWWNSSPYRITNVYIGGGLLYHECTVPDVDWVETVRNQGWGVIPTWVGPQAPCSSFRLRMSSDPEIAYQEGQAEADAASLAAWQIGLTGSGMGGSIIYYDIEAYGTSNLQCREAVKSFMTGWTERLHYWGNQAGGYGSACNSNVSDWASLTYPPDDLWVAAVSYSKYHKNVPLFGLTCVNDNLWPNHQRIRQYTIGHNETWGNVTFNIDSNIADAEVVTKTGATTNLYPPISFSSSQQEIMAYSNTPGSTGMSWLIENGMLYEKKSDAQSWYVAPNLPSHVTMRVIFLLDESSGWIITASDDESYTLYSTSNGGESWEKIASLPIASGWYPISIQFTDTQNGWIAIKNLSSNNFSIGNLMHTSDGGNSWQTLDLPFGEPVRFINSQVGWIAGGVGGNELYKTKDGGHSWSKIPFQLPKETRITISLPVFADPQNGTLYATTPTQDEAQLVLYTTRDGGETWQSADVYTKIPEGLTSINFITPQLGWGTTNVGMCQNMGNENDCILVTTLWHTQDGGKTWESIETP
jgi:photosystem II stability/assembly factor-like uncharacterized protein